MSVALGNLGPSLRHPDKPQVPADFGFRPGKATFSCLQHTGEEPLKERPSNVLDGKRLWTFVSRAASALGSISTPAVMTEMKVVERHLKRDLIRCRCTQRMNLWLPEGNDGRKEESGSLGWTCTHTTVFKLEDPQGLLYSAGNSAQCYMAAWVGGESRGEWMYVCVWLSLCCASETIKTWLISCTST